MAEVFTAAYAGGLWYNGSGSGSQPAATGEYRTFLAKYLAENDISSAVDIGCGDWKFSWLIEWPEDFRYLGIDIVDKLIRINRHDWADWGVATIEFLTADVLAMTELPDAELYIVKDLLQHWPNSAVQYLGHLLAGRRALIVTDVMRDGGGRVDMGPGLNADIAAGSWRPLELAAEPFGWPVREVLAYRAANPQWSYNKRVLEMRP